MITKNDIYRIFSINDLMDFPAAVMEVLFGDRQNREAIYRELLELAEYDLSYDWFQSIYEDELAQRKQKKQDFTPQQLGSIASLICGSLQRSVYEPTAGNGSMLIADWHNKMKNYFPWEFLPSKNQIECWELADRSIPILLLNLSIRGIMGVVYHGDVLEQTIKQKYILLNRRDDALAFSEIHKVSNSSKIVKL